jgi:hypothetical protein
MEQYAGQVKGQGRRAAHEYGMQQESLFSGWTRGAQMPLPNLANGWAQVDVRFTRGSQTVDVRTTIDPATADIMCVDRRQ